MKKNWLKGTAKIVAVLTVSALLMTSVACGDAKTPADTSTVAAQSSAAVEATPAPAGPVNIKMITWVQESNQKAIDALNASFTEKYPNVTFTVDTVGANDYPTLQNARIAAGDVDILTTNGPFDLYPADFTKGADKPGWATFVEGGAYLDITNEPFIKNWAPAMIKDAVTYQGKVYGLDMGAVGYNGLFYNKKLFDENGLKEPGTWDEFMAICKTFKDKNIAPITLGMKDGWPLDAIGVSGIVGANEADLLGYAKGLWTGTRKFTDEQSMKTWNRMAQFVSYLEKNVQAVGYGDAPGRLVAGKAAMLYDGTWNAGTFAGLDPNFEFGYFPVPGDTDNKPNQLQGKYDMQFNIAAKSPNKEWALKWFEFLSQKENYTPFVSALGFFPTMPDVTSTSAFIASMADKNKNFGMAWERFITSPKGVGKYAGGQAFILSQLKAVGGTVADVKTLAELAQKDWDAALAAAK